MMTRADGGQDWLKDHNSRYKLSKLKLVRFSRCQVPNPGHPGRTIPEPHPNLILQGTHIKPSGLHKYLGVMFDRELRWREQMDSVVAKATNWTLCFRHLARPAMGVKPSLMRQLFQAVAVPCFMYTADIWFTCVQTSR